MAAGRPIAHGSFAEVVADREVQDAYLLPPIVFKFLEECKPGHNGMIQLTDALQRLARERALIGYEFEGDRHDIGDKLGFLVANIQYGLQRSDIGPELRNFLRSLSLD